LVEKDEVGFAEKTGGDVLPGFVDPCSGGDGIIFVDHVGSGCDVDRVGGAAGMGGGGVGSEGGVVLPAFPASQAMQGGGGWIGVEIIGPVRGLDEAA